MLCASVPERGALHEADALGGVERRRLAGVGIAVTLLWRA